MNLAGFVVIALIFRPSLTSYLLSTLILSVLVGLNLLGSDYQQYVGLSGVLHGLFGLYAAREALNGRRSSWLLVVGLALKVGYELLVDPNTSTAQLIDAPVAYEAHLIGALAGLTLALLLQQRRR